MYCVSPVLIKFKRGIQASIDSFIPDDGQVILALDSKRIFIGDIITPSGNDILIGNVTNLDKLRYYGSNKNKIRGFHDLPFVINILPHMVDIQNIGVELGTSFVKLPSLNFSDSLNGSIYFTFKYLKSWDINRDLRIKLIYTIDDASDDSKTVKINTKINRINIGNDIDLVSQVQEENYVDLVKIDNKTFNRIKPITLSNAKILGVNQVTDKKEGEKIVILIERDSNDVADTYIGSFNIINIIIYQPVNGSENGYIMGGGDLDDILYTNDIEKINFPFDDSLSYKISTLETSKKNGSACNSSTFGYFMGGVNSLSKSSIIERLNFCFDTASTQASGNLTIPLSFNSSFNCSTYGFTIGGEYENNGPKFYDKIERISFNTDTFNSNVSYTLSEQKSRTNCMNSSRYGYIVNGYNTLFTNNMSRKIEKVIFSAQSGVTIETGLDSIVDLDGNNKGTHSSLCFNSYFDGYIMSGFNVNYLNKVRFFMDDTTTTQTSAKLAPSTYKYLGGGCNSSIYGFAANGYFGTTFVDTIDRVLFDFDSSISSDVGFISGNFGNSAVCDGTDFLTLFV